MEPAFETFPRDHGPWKILNRSTVYQDPWLKVTRDEVIRPDGSAGTYSLSQIKPGVCVLAMDSKSQCYLTREFHYAVGRTTLECVSGGIDSNETPIQAAQRELAEELGLVAEKWTSLGMTDPFTATASSPTSLWLAEDLTQTDRNPDASEIIELVTLPLTEIMKLVDRSEITHAPSIICILKSWIFKQM